MPNTTLRRTIQYAGLARDVIKLRHADEDHVRRQARQHLVERMGKLRGLPQKLGQMLSLSRSDDDTSAAEDFAPLQEAAEPLPLEQVRPLMETAWSAPLEQVLATIEPRAHAASLGQVHRARLHDGREVAVKVQYPGIREAITADLKLLGWLSVPLGNLSRGFDLGGYREAITADLDRELDYCQEADSQRQFARWAAEEPFLVVPEVIDELSSDRILVTTWEDGERWAHVEATWPETDRRRLANHILRFFLEGLLLRSVMHADWHPGNLRFRRDGNGGVQLVLYDFGCVYRPGDEERLALARLIRATVRRDESPWPLFLKLGFDRQYLEPMADKLPALCHLLFEPFASEYPYDLADWKLGHRVADVLGSDRWNFRIAGPPALVFLLRAFHGLIYYLEGLRTPIFWQRPMQTIFGRLATDMDNLALPESDVSRHDFTSLARHLKIRVTENGRTKVELTGYASGIDDLGNLIGDDLCQKIDAKGIDLDKIVSEVRRGGYAPGPVFELSEGAKQVAVWLE